MNHSSRSYLKSVLVVMICAMFAVAAFAQSTTDGAIAGLVTDQSKAVVIGAKVTAHNLGTNAESSATTDALGHFRIIKLQPGTYSISIAAQSFAPYTQPAVTVEIGLVTNIDFALAVAGSKEVVEVTAEAPTVNTEQQDFTTNLNQDSISNLPINGRRWSNFALLTPGATPADGYGLISFRGISGLMNNSTVDGGDNNQAFFSEERGRTRTNYVVSQNAVREFQVNTSNYSAEYGRAAGAVINTVTKSGTNALHGEGFYYIRDNELGAQNAFTTTLVKADDGSYNTVGFKPTDRRQQFGANLGGALIKDKLFFFFNYDGQRQNIPGVAMPSKPSLLFGVATTTVNGVVQPNNCQASASTAASTLFSCSELNTMAIGMFPASQVPIVNGKPAPTVAQQQVADAAGVKGIGFLADTTGIQPRANSQNIFFPKLDYRINNSNTVSLSYNRMRRESPADYQTQPVVSYALGDWGDDGVKVDMINGRLTSTLGTATTNEFRFSYGRELNFASVGPQNSLYDALKNASGSLYNNLLGDTYFAGGISYNIGLPYTLNRTSYPDERRHQFADTMTWAHGKHLVKFGADVTHTNDLMDSLFAVGGDYSYSTRAAWIIDYTNAVNPLAGMSLADNTGTTAAEKAAFMAAHKNYGSYTQSLGVPAWKFSTNEFAGFIQDDFRVAPRLTVNVGVRYELTKFPEAQIPNPIFAGTWKLPNDKNNIGPRIGFAWDVFGDGKTAVRGGYGMFYGRFANSMVLNAIYGTGLMSDGTNCRDNSGNFIPTGQACGQASYKLYNNSTGSPAYPDIISSAASTSGQGVTYFAPNAQNPLIHQADFVIERQIAKNTVVSVSYLLSIGRNLLNLVNQNQPPSDGLHNLDQFFVGGPFDGKSLSVPLYTTKVNSAYGPLTEIATNVNSNYNAMVIQANRRMTNGLQFQASYTWSHALDAGQNANNFSPTSGTNVYDPYNMKLEYGTSDYDLRHKLVTSAVWQPTFFREKGSLTKALLDGWLMAPIVVLQSGRPMTESINGYPTLPANGFGGVNWSYAWSGSSLNESGGSGRLAPFLGRNSFNYPTLWNTDFRLSRSFRIKEKQKVEVVAEAFNLFNHKIVTGMSSNMYGMCSSSTTPKCFGRPGGTGTSTSTGTPSTVTYVKDANGNNTDVLATVAPNTWVYDPTFKSVTGAGNSVYRERQVQFAIRYSF